MGGKAGSGRRIETTRGIDWLSARMKERIISLLLNNQNIPYTDAGIAKIVAEVRAQLSEGEGRGFLDESYNSTVTSPTRATASPADVVAGILRNVTFTHRLSGTIERVVINGTVTF